MRKQSGDFCAADAWFARIATGVVAPENEARVSAIFRGLRGYGVSHRVKEQLSLSKDLISWFVSGGKC